LIISGDLEVKVIAEIVLLIILQKARTAITFVKASEAVSGVLSSEGGACMVSIVK
jgi:hypothetical protein